MAESGCFIDRRERSESRDGMGQDGGEGRGVSLFHDDAKVLELRPYQLDAIERIRDLIRQGKKNIILCAPTGSGKCLGRGTPFLMGALR